MLSHLYVDLCFLHDRHTTYTHTITEIIMKTFWTDNRKLCNNSELNALLAIGKTRHENQSMCKMYGGGRRNMASLGPASRHSRQGYSKTREGWRRCDFYQRVSGFHYDFLKPNFMNEMWFFFSRSPSSSPLLSSFPFLSAPSPPSLVSSPSSHPLVPFSFPFSHAIVLYLGLVHFPAKYLTHSAMSKPVSLYPIHKK